MKIIKKEYDNGIKDCTLAILTSSNSSNFNQAQENLKFLDPKPEKSLIIIDYVPVNIAVKVALENTQTKFLIVMDDDMTLDINTVLTMRDAIEKNNLDEAIFKLDDPIFGKIVGIRIYRVKEILSIINNFNDIWQDVDIHKQLKNSNKTLIFDNIIGYHHQTWNPLDLYWRMFTVVKKLNNTPKDKKKWIMRNMLKLSEYYVKNKDDIVIYGFYGLINGILDNDIMPVLSYDKKFTDTNIKNLISKILLIEGE